MLIFFGSFLITAEPDIRRIILVLALFSLVNGFITIFYALFQARQRMEYQTWAETLQSIVATGLGIFILLRVPSVINLSYSYLFASVIGLIFVLIFFHFKVFPLKIAWQRPVWQKFLIMAWPLALTGVFDSLYNYTDSVMLGYWKMMTETGWYNAAYRITWTVYLFAGLVCASFYPVLSESFKNSKEKLQKIWNYEMEIMIIITSFLVTVGLFLAPKIIGFVYGSSYLPSALAFQILMVATGITLIYTTFKDVLIASNQQKIFFWAIFFGAITNIILNLFLIPKFSLYGAAYATVITDFLVFWMLFKLTLNFTSVRLEIRRIIPTLFISILANIIMYLVISQSKIYHLNIFLTIFIGGITYVFTIFIFRKLIQNLKWITI